MKYLLVHWLIQHSQEAGQAPNYSVDATSRPFEVSSTPHTHFGKASQRGTLLPQTVTASSTIENILTRALKARGVVLEQPFVPQSLKIIEQENDAGEAYVEVSAPEGPLVTS